MVEGGTGILGFAALPPALTGNQFSPAEERDRVGNPARPFRFPYPLTKTSTPF